MKTKIIFIAIVLVTNFCFFISANDGYCQWLRYDLISNQQKLNEYQSSISHLLVYGSSATIVSACEELVNGGKKEIQKCRINEE
jgi:hypothetical protein